MPKMKLSPADTIDLLTTRIENGKIKQRELKLAEKKLRAEKTEEHRLLKRAKNPDREYFSQVNGAKLHVVWHKGCQHVSVEYTGNGKEKTVTDAPTIKLPSTKMTWKKLRAEVVAGSTVYNKRGIKIPCTKRAEMAPTKEVKVTVEVIGKNKIYKLI